MQAWLSWAMIDAHWDDHLRTYDRFAVAKVSRYGEDDVARIMAAPGVIHSRAKIEGTIRNARMLLEIEREFDVWRLVRDPKNNRGWVHTATLASRRTLLVTGAANQVLRSAPSDDAAAVAKLEPGVIGRLRDCEKETDWCQVQVKDYKGWMKRDAFWGTLPGEAVQ